MAQAIRLSLYERGFDPADFALVSFGGAGGLHAAEIADDVGVTKVIFPVSAGTFSALGILSSDIVHSLVRTRLQRVAQEAAASLAAAAGDLRAEADALLAEDGVAEAQRRFSFALDLRYRGQGYELSVPISAAPLDAASLAATAAHFHQVHRQRFAHADPDGEIESVALRLTATGIVPKPPSGARVLAGDGVPRGSVRVFAGGAWDEIPACDRASVGGGATLAGPALIGEDFSTIYLPRGWQIAAAPGGDLIARPA
jgi:N-methylhydantoinase A